MAQAPRMVVQWELVTVGELSKHHLETETLNDTIGRTGCGRRFRQSRVQERVELTSRPLDQFDMCLSCVRAAQSEAGRRSNGTDQ